MTVKHSAFEVYRKWAEWGEHPPEIAADLAQIADDADAIIDHFDRELEFGTGGLRGVLGAGSNRMNRYTVRRATAALARVVRQDGVEAATRGVVIGYDCRRMSPEFAEEAARVLAGEGVKAYLFDHLCPTPELSFAVRALGASAGIMITASHNPPEYNGYKVYGADGGQILPDVAEAITAEIVAVGDPLAVMAMPRQEAESGGLIVRVGDEMDDTYCAKVVDALKVASVSEADRDRLHILYTPLHGTGNVPVRRALAGAGYTHVTVVPSQELPDGAFPTVQSPNPEEPEALALAIQLAAERGADVVMGTDPDADRVGIAVRCVDGSYRLLSGNQVGGLLVDFWLRHRQTTEGLPGNGVVLKTIVTSELGAAVAARYRLGVVDTLTGFKYIGAEATSYEQTGLHTFLFGYEESYGYLAAPFVRDKDAVQSCLLIAEMVAAYKRAGLTLVDALQNLYQQVGYFEEALISLTLRGADGLRKMRDTMDDLRRGEMRVEGLKLAAVEDYATGQRTLVGDHPQRVEPIALPRSDVLKYRFHGGSWLAIRPSGTEPKLKIYVGARGFSEADCQQALTAMKNALAERIQV